MPFCNWIIFKCPFTIKRKIHDQVMVNLTDFSVMLSSLFDVSEILLCYWIIILITILRTEIKGQVCTVLWAGSEASPSQCVLKLLLTSLSQALRVSAGSSCQKAMHHLFCHWLAVVLNVLDIVARFQRNIMPSWDRAIAEIHFHLTSPSGMMLMIAHLVYLQTLKTSCYCLRWA